MNDWVLKGFDETYARLGIAFDHVDYESDTYLRGKKEVEAAVVMGVPGTTENGAVVWDVPEVIHSGEKKGKGKKRKKGEVEAASNTFSKVLLRADGTSVYMTQDLGTALRRFEQFGPDQMSYVVADEQNRHFRILFHLLEEIQGKIQGVCHHLSYGLVHLPSGRMKSREGTVIDADDLLNEVEQLAAEATRARWPQLSQDALDIRARHIGLAAIKFFLLSHAPNASFVYDALRALDFQGHNDITTLYLTLTLTLRLNLNFTGRTGPYCMYTYARTRSILRKAGDPWLSVAEPGPERRMKLEDFDARSSALGALGTKEERAVVLQLMGLGPTLEYAAEQSDPSKVAAHVYDLSKV